MFIVGLTGGIGSGKTAVSNMFHKLGVPIIDADVIAHQIVEPGQAALKKIHQQFGDEIINDNGQLKRNTLRQIIFEDSEKRERLENILHPAIKKKMLSKAKKLNTHYCIFVIPLLFEARQQHLVNRILVIDTPDKLRRKRIKQRSQLSNQQIDAIFASQLKQEERLNHADEIIHNTSTLEVLKDQVINLHKYYLKI